MRKKIFFMIFLLIGIMFMMGKGTVTYAAVCDNCKAGNHTSCTNKSYEKSSAGHRYKCCCGGYAAPSFVPHTFGSWSNSGGTHSHSCIVCGHTQSHTAAFDYKKISETQHQAKCDYCTLTNGTRDHVASTAATCTTAAYCATCRSYFGGVNSNNHSWGSWTSTGATQHKRTCTRDNTHTQTANHTWNNGTITTAATCTSTGVKTFTCTTCNATKTETVNKDASNHSSTQTTTTYTYKDGTNHTVTVTYNCCGATKSTTTEAHTGGTATCTAKKTCTKCNSGYGEALGHSFADAWKSDGTNHWHECTRCNTKSGTGAHTGGTATCTEKKKCTTCGTSYGAVDANNHNWGSWTSTGATQHKRTCTRDNTHTQTADHTWNNGTITKDSTCTAKGTKTYTCTTCSGTKTEDIPMKAHEYESGWRSDGSSHWHKCKNCTAITGTGAHTGGTATCTEKKKCTTCGTSYGEVAANNHDWNPWAADGDKQHKRICKRNSNHTETGSHTDADKNGKCDVCNYVMQVEPTLTISPTTLSIVYGSSGTFTYNYNGDATPTVSVGSTNIARASINTSAKTITITTVAVGETSVTISCAATAKYFAKSVSATIKVTRQPIGVPTGTNFTYDGTQHTGLSSTVQYTAGGTYYATNAGSYTATATPTANYMWTDGGLDARNVSWSITAKSLTAGGMNATLNQTSYVYDGSPKTPGVTVTDGSKTLTPGTDYTVKYENNKDAGRGKVTVTGQGNYQGSITLEFDITRKPIAKPTATNRTYNRSSQVGVPTGEGYSLTGNPTAIENGTYNVTVTLNSNYQWADGSITNLSLSWIMNRKDIASDDVTKNITTTTKTYNGSAQTQTISLTHAGATLSNSTEYSVSYASNTNAGTATITITGKGNYTGTVTRQFTINAKSLTSGDIKATLGQTSYVYDGSPKTPGVTVTDGSKTLTPGTDYTVKYESNTNAGKGKVTVTGQGNYQGSITVEFEITRKPIAKPTATNKTYNRAEQIGVLEGTGYVLSGNPRATNQGTYYVTVTLDSNYQWNDYTILALSLSWIISPKNIADEDVIKNISLDTKTYNQNAQTQSVTLTHVGATLQLNTEYTVGYTNNVNAGTATITVTGQGNYTGTVTKYFTINPKSFTAGDIQSSLSETTYEYDKQPKTPGVTVQDGGKVLTGVDYDVRYENNTEVGTAKVVITGKGNYEGTIEKEFTIQDTTPPSIPIVTAKINQAGGETYVSGTWTNQNIYVSLQSTDYSTFKYQYRIGTTGAWKDMPAEGVELYKDEMNQEFYYRAIDIYNNASAASTGITLRIDKTNPTVGTLKAQIRDANGLDYDFGTVSEKSIYVALDSLGSDDASSVKETTYTIDQVDDENHNRVIKNIVTNEKTARVLADGGTYRVTVTTIDVAGNSTTSKPYIIIIARDFTNIIRLNNLYDVGSGIKDITITITKAGESEPTYTETISTYEANFVKRVKLPDGVFDINVVIQDKAGNSKTLTGKINNVIW